MHGLLILNYYMVVVIIVLRVPIYCANVKRKHFNLRTRNLEIRVLFSWKTSTTYSAPTGIYFDACQWFPLALYIGYKTSFAIWRRVRDASVWRRRGGLWCMTIISPSKWFPLKKWSRKSSRDITGITALPLYIIDTLPTRCILDSGRYLELGRCSSAIMILLKGSRLRSWHIS